MDKNEITLILNKIDSIKEQLGIIPTKAISISQRKQWAQCKRKWALERVFMDYTPKDFFAIGKAVHTSLESYYKNGNNLAAALLDGKVELMPSDVDFNFLDAYPLVETMVTGYIDYDSRHRHYEIIATEIDFTLLLNNLAENCDISHWTSEQLSQLYKVKGVIDFIAVTTVTLKISEDEIIPKGTIIAGEYKTAKQAGNIDYETDGQATLYLWALSKLLNTNVEYIVYNTLYKKIPKEPEILKNGDVSAKAITTTQLIYGEALRNTYGKIDLAPEKCIALYNNLANSDVSFYDRKYIKRTENEKESFRAEMLLAVAQINEDWNKLNAKLEETNEYDFKHCITSPTRECLSMCSQRENCIKLNRKEDVAQIVSRQFSVNLIDKKKKELDIEEE